MPTWGELLLELGESGKGKPMPEFDTVRRKYLAQLHAHTDRNVILYATRWTQGGGDSQLTSIVPEDVHGLMEVVHGLDFGKGLDVILHSPGGSPDAAEAMVHYLREKFDDIRVIVPQAAMSAATMLACAADRIVMGAHSSLGPIDPQVIMGNQLSPAQAILDQFERARKECREDPKNLGAWAPILPQYGPALLTQCENALKLAEELASEWLCTWMLADQPDRVAKSKAIAKALADHAAFKSHGRPIHRERALELGLVVAELESDQVLQDLVLTVFHATMHVFSALPPVAKIIENHLGRAFVKRSAQKMQFALAPPAPGGLPKAPAAPAAPPAQA